MPITVAPPTPEPGETSIPSTPTITPSPTPAFQICSPLGMHPLSELPLIISDPYKPPPPNKPEERHHGVDFSYWHYGERDSMQGEPVQAILPGEVAAVLNDRYPYGNMLLIETARDDFPAAMIARLRIPEGESVYHLYAHLLNPPNFAISDKIEICQPLGEVGESGNTDIPHLHLETRLGPAGQVFESMLFYSTRATQEEMENYVLWRTSGVFRHFDPMLLLGTENSGD